MFAPGSEWHECDVERSAQGEVLSLGERGVVTRGPLRRRNGHSNKQPRAVLKQSRKLFSGQKNECAFRLYSTLGSVRGRESKITKRRWDLNVLRADRDLIVPRIRTAGLSISYTWGLRHKFCRRGPILIPRPVLESPT